MSRSSNRIAGAPRSVDTSTLRQKPRPASRCTCDSGGGSWRWSTSHSSDASPIAGSNRPSLADAQSSAAAYDHRGLGRDDARRRGRRRGSRVRCPRSARTGSSCARPTAARRSRHRWRPRRSARPRARPGSRRSCPSPGWCAWRARCGAAAPRAARAPTNTPVPMVRNSRRSSVQRDSGSNDMMISFVPALARAAGAAFAVSGAAAVRHQSVDREQHHCDDECR